MEATGFRAPLCLLCCLWLTGCPQESSTSSTPDHEPAPAKQTSSADADTEDERARTEPRGEPALVTLSGGGGSLTAVAWSRDGAFLAGGGAKGEITLWRIGRRPGFVGQWTAEGGRIDALAFSPDGATLASGGRGAHVTLWDTKTKAKRTQLRGHKSWITGLGFARDGSKLFAASADTEVWRWAVKNGAADKRLRRPEGGELACLAADPQGDTIAVCQGNVVRLWNPIGGEQLGQLVHRDVVSDEGRLYTPATFGAAFHPSEEIIATAGQGRRVSLWQRSGDLIRTLEIQAKTTSHSVRDVSFSKDGATLFSAGPDGIVQLWHHGEGKAGRKYVVEGARAWDIAPSPDGRFLALAAGPLRLIRLSDGAPLRLDSQGGEAMSTALQAFVSGDPVPEAHR